MPNVPTPETRWTSAQTRAQYGAISWLRWRILINGFRRKGSTGDIIAMALVFPVIALVGLAVSFAAGFFAYHMVSTGQFDHISWLLWGTFALCQFLNINVGQPGTTFDPTQLIRFPLRSGNYIAIRLFFGILSPANVMASLLSLAIAIGASLAQPALWPYALLAMAVFAWTNALFTRMIFAWIDRWLSTRRAREIFTSIIFLGSLGFQYLNVKFNPAYDKPLHGHAHAPPSQLVLKAIGFYHHIHPLIAGLPPEITGSAIAAAARHHSAAFVGDTLGCAVFALVFFCIFALRTRTEFRGEAFSDAANAVARLTPARTAAAAATAASFESAPLAPATQERSTLGFSPVVSALFSKEILTIRRNTGVFYALVAPVVMVFIFAGRVMSRSNNYYAFPSALAYALVGIIPLAFNSFGLEGPGCQLYFLVPVRLRDVFLAKNLVNFLLAAAEVAAVFAVVIYYAGVPTVRLIATVLLWAAATLLVTTTFGNRRSITAPKKIDLGRTSSKQASPLSALMGIGILLASAACGAGLLIVARYFEITWILPLVVGVFAAFALVFYLQGLRSIERFTLAHREELFLELCKK